MPEYVSNKSFRSGPFSSWDAVCGLMNNSAWLIHNFRNQKNAFHFRLITVFYRIPLVITLDETIKTIVMISSFTAGRYSWRTNIWLRVAQKLGPQSQSCCSHWRHCHHPGSGRAISERSVFVHPARSDSRSRENSSMIPIWSFRFLQRQEQCGFPPTLLGSGDDRWATSPPCCQSTNTLEQWASVAFGEFRFRWMIVWTLCWFVVCCNV